jgi:hypothetical protein
VSGEEEIAGRWHSMQACSKLQQQCFKTRGKRETTATRTHSLVPWSFLLLSDLVFVVALHFVALDRFDESSETQSKNHSAEGKGHADTGATLAYC